MLIKSTGSLSTGSLSNKKSTFLIIKTKAKIKVGTKVTIKIKVKNFNYLIVIKENFKCFEFALIAL